jgi:glucosamine kinase
MEILLAIDGGGSRTRCLALDRSGRVVGSGESGPSNHLLVDRETVVSSLSAAIAGALGGEDRSEVVCLSAGMAGVDYDGAGAAEMEAVFRALGFAHLVINGDMVIAHAGALGGQPGVLALAGTGSAILGIGLNGERVKVGGWGPVYGDEGSAYRIAQSALIAAARAYDGRGPQTELLPAMTEALGLHEFKETVARIYTEKMEPREIAALSHAVYETAETGDEVARNIFLRTGEDLAEGVAAALRQLTLTGEQKVVSYQGSVLTTCTLARERFSEKLLEQFPDASIRPPRGMPVIGAYLLGCEVLGWPLPVERKSS